MHQVTLLPSNKRAEVRTGALLTEAVRSAGEELLQPCGGQGRCGRCAVIVRDGDVRRRSTIRLTKDDLAQGYALACQTVVEGDVSLMIPEQEQVVRRLVTDRTALRQALPFEYDQAQMQSLRAIQLTLPPPTLDDSQDDLNRLQRAAAQAGLPPLAIEARTLAKLAAVLRQSNWAPWLLIDVDPLVPQPVAHVVDVSVDRMRPVGLAVDIGTTTVTIFQVDLDSGEVLSSAAEYNGQIACGEDVISRIVYASKGDGLQDLGRKLRDTLEALLERVARRTGVSPDQIGKVTVVGNTTMIHLFLGLPPESIRLTPYTPTANQPPVFRAADIALAVHPNARVDCLPGVASYVGADISAGVLASGLGEGQALTLFIDVGTNGEMVLGTADWTVACACSAGPAFEGAGVVDGMRATTGAIEEVWIHSQTYEPTIRVIGGGKPAGLCGSALISLLAELFVTGVLDKGGNVKLDLDTPRVRAGEHGPEYVVAWADETETGHDICLTKVDVDNLMRAKAAIYAGFSVLAASVGVDLADVKQVLIGGAFGKYINVEKAIQIGLLPDLPWERFRFLGNTAIRGAYLSLLSSSQRCRVADIAQSMTYLELSADNAFFDAFTAALFLPHTEIHRFPNVAEIWSRQDGSTGNRVGTSEPVFEGREMT
jgi:uncharacterized 2Fe-2S/4Fe-4S cluster protein (DUF4445 family)